MKNKLLSLCAALLIGCGGGSGGGSYSKPVATEEYEICVEVDIQHLHGNHMTLGDVHLLADGVQYDFDGVRGGSHIIDTQADFTMDFYLLGRYFDYNVSSTEFNYIRFELLEQGGQVFGDPVVIYGNRDIAECW